MEDMPDHEAVAEFKTAATAITKLYKLANAQSKNAHELGYSRALQDLLDACDENPYLDARSWALKHLSGIKDQDAEMFNCENSDEENYSAGDKRPHHASFKSKRHRGEDK